MRRNKFVLKLFLGFIVILFSLYFFVVPILVSNNNLVDFICSKINRNSSFSIIIKDPLLRTYPNSNIRFEVKHILLTQDNKNIFEIKSLKTNFSIKGILQKKLFINKFELDYIFANIDNLIVLSGTDSDKNNTPSNWKIDLYDSVLSLKKGLFLYSPTEDIDVVLNLKDFNIDNTQKDLRYIKFSVNSEIKKDNKNISLNLTDNNAVFIKNKHLYIDNCIFKINNSQIAINAEGSRENGLKTTLSSKKFKIKDLAQILSTNLIIANGSEILSYFKDIDGELDFNIKLKDISLNGDIFVNKAFAKLTPINDLPLSVMNGHIILTPEEILLKDFNGYYGKNVANKATIEGIIKDYTKSVDTNIVIKTSLNREFSKDYLSAIIGIPIEILGNAGTKITIQSLYNNIDITALTGLPKGEDFLIDGVSLTPKDYDRAIKADLKVRDRFLNIENIHYYIASELKKGVKVQPVVTLRGQFDISKPIPEMRALGFEVPKPLPSEFLNVLIAQKLFKGGIFDGKLYYVNLDGNPSIKGNINAENIRIPSQRLLVQNAKLTTDNDTIHLVSNGRYKRSNFVFSGDIKSSFKYPIVIKRLDFQLDKLNLEKLLNSFQQPPQAALPIEAEDNATDVDDDSVTFDFNNLIIENCVFKLKEGSYKDINFGNLSASLTLNDKNILELKSNRFDIAEGISTIKVFCDLANQKYSLKLGVKDVNSDLISSVLLNLPREISGKASGLIDLHTDNSLKLNGKIKFSIKDGQIQKIGLVEYLMKFAALFRNPIVMISPSIISDIVNIPEGNFEKINGELNIENNFVKLLKISSSSSQLSSYIVGCYNIETSDAILRIYTKFSNKNRGVAGFLRNLSLNSIANKIPLSSTSDINYYGAELKNIPEIDAEERDCQIFLTTVDGDLEHNNFLSSLKKIK